MTARTVRCTGSSIGRFRRFGHFGHFGHFGRFGDVAIFPIFTLLALIIASPASAHDARPLSVAIAEQANDIYRVVVRAPPTIDARNAPQIAWPDVCQPTEAASTGALPASTLFVSCPGGLETQTIRIEYPYFNPSITTLIRLQTAGGTPSTVVLPPDELAWTVPAEPTYVSVALDYLNLGFRHILEGSDHLLFVAGLLLLARRPKPIFWAITGFTLAHSITLSISALGLLQLAVDPVEAMIALSILFLAVEIARNDATSFSRRYPIVLSFAFGLLHGFGFASALGEIGLPGNELPAGLLFFNFGVELGQLAFIAVIVAVGPGLGRLLARLVRASDWSPGRVGLVGAYCLGVPAAFWFIERTASAFSL
jgi:hydrogenase/urease accessory protein HupE